MILCAIGTSVNRYPPISHKIIVINPFCTVGSALLGCSACLKGSKR